MIDLRSWDEYTLSEEEVDIKNPAPEKFSYKVL